MPRVLVVDDSAVDRRFVGGVLTKAGRYQVEFAEDGSQALSQMRQAPPDLIVTDLQMPNRNGLELVAAVRMHHPDVPIILMTGHGSEALARAGPPAFFPSHIWAIGCWRRSMRPCRCRRPTGRTIGSFRA